MGIVEEFKKDDVNFENVLSTNSIVNSSLTAGLMYSFSPDYIAIYFCCEAILNQKVLHLIPNPPTLNNLFKSGTGVTRIDKEVSDYFTGPALSDGALLIKAENTIPVYLLSNLLKRHIANIPTFNDCNFDASKIVELKPIVFNSIPTGPDINFH